MPPMKSKSVRLYCANFPLFLSFVYCSTRSISFLSRILQGDTKLAIDHQFGQITTPFSFIDEIRKRKFVLLLQLGGNGLGFIKPFFLISNLFFFQSFIFIFYLPIMLHLIMRREHDLVCLFQVCGNFNCRIGAHRETGLASPQT